MTIRSSPYHAAFATHQQQNSQKDPDDLLTVKEVALILRLDTSTIRRWIKEYKIDAVELPHSHKRTVYRVKRRTLETLLVERPIP